MKVYVAFWYFDGDHGFIGVYDSYNKAVAACDKGDIESPERDYSIYLEEIQ